MPSTREAPTAIPTDARPGIRHWSTGSADTAAVAAMIEYLADEVRETRPLCAYLLVLARAELESTEPAPNPAERNLGVFTS